MTCHTVYIIMIILLVFSTQMTPNIFYAVIKKPRH